MMLKMLAVDAVAYGTKIIAQARAALDYYIQDQGWDAGYASAHADVVFDAPEAIAVLPDHDKGHPHLIDGEFQSDKYPTCPRGKVPLSVKDKTAQGLLWEYAQRRRPVDAQFAADLEMALRSSGYEPNVCRISPNFDPDAFSALLAETSPLRKITIIPAPDTADLQHLRSFVAKLNLPENARKFWTEIMTPAEQAAVNRAVDGHWAGLAEAVDASEPWVIRKGGCFYRDNRAGYTNYAAAAGIYSREEAEREARVEPATISAHRLAEFRPELQRQFDMAKRGLDAIDAAAVMSGALGS